MATGSPHQVRLRACILRISELQPPLPSPEAEKVKALTLPPKSPNLNAFAERWVRSVKEECLSKLILFGEPSLKRALHHYEKHYHQERNHQGKDNLLLLPLPTRTGRSRKHGKLRCRQRLGGLLKYYEHEAA